MSANWKKKKKRFKCRILHHNFCYFRVFSFYFLSVSVAFKSLIFFLFFYRRLSQSGYFFTVSEKIILSLNSIGLVVSRQYSPSSLSAKKNCSNRISGLKAPPNISVVSAQTEYLSQGNFINC